MKGQVSTELLIVVGIILVLFIPVLITVYLKTTEAGERLASFQSVVAQSRLVNTVNSIGQLGAGAYIITEIYIPSEVQKIDFLSLGDGGEIVFHVRQYNETSELAEVVKFPLDASPLDNPHEGTYRFNISNDGATVSITRLS